MKQPDDATRARIDELVQRATTIRAAVIAAADQLASLTTELRAALKEGGGHADQ